MSKINIELATEKDDAQLRKCIAQNSMKGSIELSFETEPDFFKAVAVQGKKVDVIVGRDREGEIQGFGVRAIKPVYINGKPTDISYLSGLRVNADFRRNVFLARGYHFLKELDSNGRFPFYLTTIISDNKEALRTLESGKAGLPKYQKLCRFRSFFIPLQTGNQNRNYEIREGSEFSLDEILRFMITNGSEKQFFPAYETRDFPSDFTNGLTNKDFYVAITGKNIVGVLALWDQKNIKQTRVKKYNGILRYTRNLVNLVSPLLQTPLLPSEGELFNNSYIGMPVSRENKPEIIEAILSYLFQNAKNFKNLVVGFSERDPLLDSLRKFRKREYDSNIYVVSFNGINLDKLNLRIPYLETVAL